MNHTKHHMNGKTRPNQFNFIVLNKRDRSTVAIGVSLARISQLIKSDPEAYEVYVEVDLSEVIETYKREMESPVLGGTAK